MVQHQCKAIAKTKGMQCQNKALEGHVFCHVHRNQSRVMFQRQCEAIAKTKGIQCQNKALEGHVFCHVHRNQSRVMFQRQCEAIAKTKGIQCQNKALEGHVFCHVHRNQSPKKSEASAPNPETQRRIVAADDFRKPNLHSSKQSVVLEYRGQKDAYTNKRWSSAHELDHVLELHVVRDNFVQVRKQGNSFVVRQEKLMNDLIRVVNDTPNLNFTSRIINITKHHGFKNFQKEYWSNDRSSSDDIVHYLKASSVQNEKLKRRETAAIRKELLHSYDAVEAQLRHENALHEDFSYHLHKNLAAMKIFH